MKKSMRWAFAAMAASCMPFSLPLAAHEASTAELPAPEGTTTQDRFSIEFVRLGLPNAEALVYWPSGGKATRIALVYAHPNGNTFQEKIAGGMAQRGYPIAMVNVRTAPGESDDAYAQGISQAIRYMRGRPGVERVVLVGHSGGGHLAAFYENIAENGPAACNGSDKIYPCSTALVTGLEKPDGLVLLDPTLGAFHQANSIDPAVGKAKRDLRLDMFASANGFDAARRTAHYSPAFTSRFLAAQAARSNAVTADALARLRAIDAGSGQFNDDEPFLVKGMGVTSSGARLYQPDLRLLAHTRGSYDFYQADGSRVIRQIPSARPVLGDLSPEARNSLAQMAQNTTVRRYLASSAIRIGPDYTISEDGISGVDWRSAFTSTPGNAEGIKAPTLVLVMGCHYLVVPGEIIYEHLAAKDKTLAGIEGATHLFKACKPEYGRTMERTFDVVGEWLGKAGRF